MNVVSSWSDLTEENLASLDLRQFLGGRSSPYVYHDNSLEKSFALGKSVMQGIVSERVRFVDGRVLDLLSGHGRWLPFLAEVNREVVAIERLDACNQIARGFCRQFGINNVTFMDGDISLVEELDANSFDFVWMWSGLQYVERAYALKQIHRIFRAAFVILQF